MPEVTTVLSTVSGIVTATFKIAEKVFEIRAVGEQSTSLVETINQVNRSLDTAKSLRRQKSHLFSTCEKDCFDQTFAGTEKALDHVGKLVENARVDQQVYGIGSVRFQNKVLFVLRDSPHIMVSLQQLVIANQQLNTAIVRMDNRQAPRIVIAQAAPDLTNGALGEQKPPPSYEDSQMIAAIRQKSLRKRSSALSVGSYVDLTDRGSLLRHQSSSTDVSSLYSMVEAGCEAGGSAASVNLKEAIISSSQLDEACGPLRSTAREAPSSTNLGRARSRRWLEAHCR